MLDIEATQTKPPEQPVSEETIVQIDGHDFVQVGDRIFKAVEPYNIVVWNWVMDTHHRDCACLGVDLPLDEGAGEEEEDFTLYYMALPGVASYRLNYFRPQFGDQKGVYVVCALPTSFGCVGELVRRYE